MGVNVQYKAQALKLSVNWSPPITWTEVGLWSVVFFGAFLGVLKRYAPWPAGLTTVAFDGLCFFLLVYVVGKRVFHSRIIPYSPITIPLLVFTSFSLLSIFNPYVTSYTRGLLGWRFLASSMLFHFLGFYAFDDVKRIRRFFAVFWFVAALVSVYGVVQLLRGYTAVELAWINNLAATMRIAGTGRYRIMATMGSGVDLGFFLALAMSTLVGYALSSRRFTLNKIIILSLMVIAIAFTYVRAAWASLFLSIVYVIILNLWFIRKYRLLFPLFALLILLSAFFTPFIVANLATLFDDPALQERLASLSNPLADRSIIQRFDRWSNVWSIVREYPYGLGVGMTGATTFRFADNPGPAGVTMDNSYLKILVETGWIGLGFFLWLIGAVLNQGRKVLKVIDSTYRADGLALIACFVGFIVILFFGEYIELNPSRTLIWIFTGFLFSLPRLQKSKNKNDNPTS